MRFFEKGQDELGARIAWPDPAEIGAVCASRAVVGCDLGVERVVSNGELVESMVLATCWKKQKRCLQASLVKTCGCDQTT